jgi:hypothetical protein
MLVSKWTAGKSKKRTGGEDAARLTMGEKEDQVDLGRGFAGGRRGFRQATAVTKSQSWTAMVKSMGLKLVSQ